MAETSWFLYLIRTRHNTLYTGITTDVAQRLSEHESGKQGAKYLRAKGPLAVVYSLELGSRSLASKAEYRIKRLAKAQKEKIVDQQPNRLILLRWLNVAEGEQ
jgi:putative endonuclease